MGKGRPRAVEKRVLRQTLDAPNRVCLDVPSAPVYYPTEDEFKDPLEYISRIRPEAEPYGICRIVPPASWKPPFALDLSSFTFPTKTQAIHRLQVRAPACDRETFELDYNRFLEERCGRKAKRRVVFEGEDLDLCKLFNAVKRFGGYDKVVKDKKWAEVFRFVRASGKVTDCAKHVLCQLYREHLCDYEEYYNRLSKKKVKCCKRRAELSKASDHAVDFGGVKRRRKNRVAQKARVEEEENDQICEQCKIGLHGEVMLLCDRCNKGWHIYCLSPPLKEVPPGNWYCLDCLNSSEDNFGFVPGKQLSLEDFRRVADRANKRWFGSGPTSRVQIEMKFWEIVEGSAGKVEVMYGSDLDTSEYGSGFPRANDKIPASVDANTWNKHCANPWNLNNLPKLNGSMLHSVHQNIAGVMVPWLYVGMLFSSFCWHFEDHCFYSMNYLHWGEPKCWYSVPGSEANAFEKVMRISLPDLFDAQPDLLFQLVTMLSPSVLKENGVSVYTVLQEPGNFVVTFPRSFHGGFNFGLNCAEAVNFAPADWIPHGGLCADLYRLYRKPAVISHEELLFVAAKSNHDARDLCFLKNELQRLFMKEKSLRECLWKNGVVKSASMSPRRYPEYVGIEEDPTCIICRQYLFLSAIFCCCRPSAFVCLEHWRRICECKPSKHRLLYRHTLAELNNLLCTLDGCNLEETQNNKLLSDFSFSDNTCAVARKVEGGHPTLVELAGQWLLHSANALQNPFSKVVFQKLLKEAEQFLWAGSDMDSVRDMNRKLTEALSWAERVQNCLCRIETFSDSGGEVNRINDLDVAELLDCNPLSCHEPGVLKLKDYAEEAKKLAEEIESTLSSPIKLPELEDLYRRSCNLQIYVQGHNELKLKISLVKDCIKSARRYLTEKCPASIRIDSLYKLNSQIIQLQLLHPEAKLLGDLVEKTESCCISCADLLEGPISLENVERFLQQMDSFTVDIPELKLLQQYQLQTVSWISRFKSIWSDIHERNDHHNVVDELRTLQGDAMSLKIEVRELPFVELELKKSSCRAKALKGQTEKMSVDFLQQLLIESSSLEIQGERLFIHIAGIVQAATDWEHNAERILSARAATLSEFEEAITLSEEIQAILPSLVDVLRAYEVAKSWLNNSAPFLESSHSALHPSNSLLKVEKLKELVSESKLLKVSLGESWRLELISFKCKEWEQEASGVLLNVESFLTTSDAAFMEDGLSIKIQDLIISLDAVLTAELSLVYDFGEIPRLRNAHSVLSWCHRVISISSSSPSVQEVELLLKIQEQTLFSFRVGDLPGTLLEGLKWMKKAAEIIYATCKFEEINLCDVEEALAERQMIPLLFPVMHGKLAEARTKHELWLEKARQFLDLEASQRSWILLLQIQATGKTDAFNCVELFTILSEVERVENWRYQLREVMGISSSDSNSLICSMEKIRRTLDRSVNVYGELKGGRMHNLCMCCSNSFEDDQLVTCSMCKDRFHEQCLGYASFNEEHCQELCSFCQLSKSEFDLQIVKSHLTHLETKPSLDVFSKLATEAEDLFIRIEERDTLKLLLESANSCRECSTQITDLVMGYSGDDFGIFAQKLIIALKAASVAGIHDHQGNGVLELAFRRYVWWVRARRVSQGLQKPNVQHIHALLREGNAVDISPEDPCWHKLMELKSIALQWSKIAKKVASDSGACGLDQVFEVIWQGENLPINVEKQLKLLRTRSILYCICRKPYDRRPMIACDQCGEWYHFACVKLHSVPKIYTCFACEPEEESFCQKQSKNEESTTSGVIEPKTPCARDRLIREESRVGYSEELVSSITNEKTVYFCGKIDDLRWCNRKPFGRAVRKRSDLVGLLVSPLQR